MKSASFLLSLLFTASSSFGGWSSSGPTGGAVNAVVVAASDPAVIWAGSSGGVFRSTDGGATWANVSGPLTSVARIVVHPNDPDKAWALSAPLGLYRTVDGGAIWISSNRFAGITPTALLIDPRDPDTLYVSGNCYAGFDVAFLPWMGVHKSTDGGVTWTTLGVGGAFTQCVQELAIDPFSPWRLFLGGAYGSTSESYDAANRWERPQGPRPTRDVLFDPRYPFTHFGISSQLNSFLISQDGGFTWSAAATKPPAQVRSLTIDPERGRLFIGTVNGMFRSGNAGRVWAATQLPESEVSALAFAGTPPSVFAATNQGLYQVVNRGLGEARLMDLQHIATRILAMEVDPSDPRIVYASTTDSVHGRVFYSTNGGASWQRVPGDVDDVIRHIAIDAAGTVYAAAHTGRSLYRRKRGETQWTKIRNASVDSLAADPKTPGRVFFAGTFGVERSVDGGDNWQPLLSTYGSIVVDPSDPRWVYQFSHDNLYRSSDGGVTWADLQHSGVSDGTRGLAVAPSNGKVLYRIGANDGRLRPERSDDRGETWRAAPLPFGVYPSSLAVDPKDEDSVWAAVYDYAAGLYHSADGGAHWSEVKGPKGEQVAATALRFDPTRRLLHVAYPGHGVWELTLD
jgi:photosystem II stability/assembly factor-like uncharacterized protein